VYCCICVIGDLLEMGNKFIVVWCVLTIQYYIFLFYQLVFYQFGLTCSVKRGEFFCPANGQIIMHMIGWMNWKRNWKI